MTAQLLDAQRADGAWRAALSPATPAAVQPHATARYPPSSFPSLSSQPHAAAEELPLRLRYSLPLVRLVNGVADSQQRGRVASSVAVLADAAGDCGGVPVLTPV